MFTNTAGRTLTYSGPGGQHRRWAVSPSTPPAFHLHTTVDQRIGCCTSATPVTDAFTITAATGVYTVIETVTVLCFAAHGGPAHI